MRRRTLGLALLVALAPLAGCLSAEGGPSGAIVFETIDRGPDSGIAERQETVVRSAEAWHKLWDRHAPEEDRPEVDFDERMVLAAFKGESPDSCHGAEIENATGEEDRIRVEVAYFEVTDAHCTQQITHPFHIVALDRHDVDVRFDTSEETRQIDGSADGGDGSDGDATSPYTCREIDRVQEPNTTGSVGFETLDEGPQSNIEQRCVTVADDRPTWRKLWRDHHGASTADEQRPAVDFTNRTVAAIFKGQSPDACHGAEIEDVIQDGDDAIVHAVFYVEQDEACAEVITHPFHIVALDRPEGEVVFDVREETR